VIDLPTPELSAEWVQVDSRLHLIVSEIEEEANQYGQGVRVTSLIRGGNKRSPHAYGRACDLSVRGWPRELIGQVLRLNHRFQYPRRWLATIMLESPDASFLAPFEAEYPRPVTLLSARATAPHIHVQVPEEPTPEWETLPDEAYDY